jgi:hypothetical protein
VPIAREVRQVRRRLAVVRRQEVVDLAVVPLGRDGFGEHERRGEGRDRAGGAVGGEVLAVAAAGDVPVSAVGLAIGGAREGVSEGGYVHVVLEFAAGGYLACDAGLGGVPCHERGGVVNTVLVVVVHSSALVDLCCWERGAPS